MKMDIIIKPLTPDVLDDFLYYFENVGFADNPEWAGCYCHFYHFGGNQEEWTKRTKEENKKASINLITSGKMLGFLAYSNEKPIGWCNANPVENFAKEIYKDDSPKPQKKKTAGIVCFLIAPTQRKKGVARKLLKYACSFFKNNGYNLIESYPRSRSLSDAYSYRGPISLYKSEGFNVYKEFKDFSVMRKEL